MSAKKTVKLCATLFEELLLGNIDFETFEKILLRKQRDLKSGQMEMEIE